MRKRVSELDMNDTVKGSSNFGKFIKLFEGDDTEWIDKINSKIKE